MKRTISIFLVLALVFSMAPSSMLAAEGLTLESIAEKHDYEFNANGNRTSKTIDGVLYTFSYGEESDLQSEIRGDKHIDYLYDYFDYGKITGFVYEGDAYHFIKDDDYNVIGITDAQGNEVSRYEYDANGIVVSIFGKDGDGNWVNYTNDNTFIGHINKIRLHSLYFDDETGLYSDGRNFLDSVKNIFVGKLDILDEVSTYEGYQAYLARTSPYSIRPFGTPLENARTDVNQWKAVLKNTADFGKSIAYTSNWYASLSDVELIARLFYGESGIDSTMKDSRAVFWVFKNLATSDGLTYRANATKSGRFSSIVAASSSETNAARNPSTSSTLWDNAVFMACSLLLSGVSSYWEDLNPRPTGISGQLNFRSLNWAQNSSNARDYNSKLQFYVNGTWKNVKNVVVVSTTSYITSYTSLSGLSNPSGCTYNVYFDWE